MTSRTRLSQVEQPQPFDVVFDGPTGPYKLSFQPDHDEGHFDAVIGDVVTRWHVEVCERENDGWLLAGMTRETKGLWGDSYWFEVHIGDDTRAEYCLQGLVRTDLPLP